MEAINFNEYTKSERYDIISSILRKMSDEGVAGNTSAERFFDFYFEKFYKLPAQIRNDIIYCQRAMKTYLQVHHLVVQVFAQQPDADPVQKDKFLHEIEDQLYEINAENSYLTLRMREHIDDFCSVFQSHGINCNQELIRSVISHEMTPMITNTQVPISPIDVVPRETKTELMNRFFTVCSEDKSTVKQPAAEPPFIIETVDISDDDDDANDQNAQNVSCNVGQKVTEAMAIKTDATKPIKVLAPTQSKNVRRKTGPLQPAAKSVQRLSMPGSAKAANIVRHPQKSLPAAPKSKVANNTSSNAASTSTGYDQVKASRINFLQVLKRTRTERLKSEAKPAPKTQPKTQQKQQQHQQQQQRQQELNALQKQQPPKQENDNKNIDKSGFMRSLGLCTLDEFNRIATVQCQIKLRSFIPSQPTH